jgi:hydroxypyruvate isomerase
MAKAGSGFSRRTLLANGVASGVAIATGTAAVINRPRLSVRVEALFPTLSLPEQLRRVSDAGYRGFEFGDWRAQDARRINTIKNQLGLECVCLVGNRGVNPKGMGLCDPSEREGFLAEIRQSIVAAQRFESSKIVVLTGYRVAHLSRQDQHESIVEGLKRGAAVAEAHGITLIVEPINTLAKVEPLNPTGDNHADYFLDTTREAVEIIRKVDSPFVKVLYDLYHAQIMEGNLIETIREHIAQFAHIHVADVPGRQEPGTGEIHFGNVFRAIAATGYQGYIGMEYVPKADPMATLATTKQLLENAFAETSRGGHEKPRNDRP